MDWHNDFNARVNFAASYISGGKRTSRRFDSCFENNDGDAVVTALYRRTRERPGTKLAANLFNYLCRESVMQAVADLEHIRTEDLPNVADRMREESRRKFKEDMARLHAA